MGSRPDDPVQKIHEDRDVLLPDEEELASSWMGGVAIGQFALKSSLLDQFVIVFGTGMFRPAL